LQSLSILQIRCPAPTTRSHARRWLGGVIVAVSCFAGGTRVSHAGLPVTQASATPTWLDTGQARRYMVQLINRDRATQGLTPVELDEGPPTVAGQRHADDMAVHAYLGHWGSDGSVPEQRLTEAGGADMVLENASCFTDEKARALDASPKIAAADVEKTESMFFNEQPPNDGHRKNILKPFHKRVGIGVAQPVATPTEIPTPCFSQEFIDPYGSYSSLPKGLHVGDRLSVSGKGIAPAQITGVGLARVDLPRALPVAEVNKRRSYPVPVPYQVYWPVGFVTPIPLTVKGEDFAITIPVSDQGKPGLYEVSIWAKLPGNPDMVMVGLRTLPVQ
jgi:uncharacterized protein YkwD